MKNDKRSIMFIISTCFFWFSLYAYVPILSPYAQSLGASYNMIGLIIGSYGFTQMLLRIPLGIISDKINERKIFIIIGIFLTILSSLGMWLFKNPLYLLIFRGLSGGAAASWVTFTVLYSSYFNKNDTSKALGILNSFSFLGQMSATLLGGIVAQKLNIEFTFMLAFIGGLISILFGFQIHEEKSIIKKSIELNDLLKIIKDKNLLLVSALAIISQLITFGTVYGFTPVNAKIIGANSIQLGILSTLSILPSIFSSAISGTYFTKKIGEKNSIIFSFIIISISCFSIPFINNINILYLSQFIGGFGRGIVFPLLMSLSIKNVNFEKRATAMGFFQSIYGLGMFLGPVIVGFLGSQFNLTIGFLTMGLFGIIGAIISFLYLDSIS